ncbi:Abi family protein [Actinomycetota bacterium]|uniref:Abi family protein n=1 Tax=Nostocoides veronense TaxID=330836 RepID=A0ABP4YC95_9MICO
MYVWDTKSPEPLNDAQLGDFLLPERQRSRARGVERYLKPALSQSDLLDRWQQRGLILDDRDRAARYLRHIGYYRMSAYVRSFEADERDILRAGTTFDEVLGLYIFDRKLRLIVLDALERVEVAVRAALGDQMALVHGPHWYENSAHFARPGTHTRLLEDVDRMVTDQIQRPREQLVGQDSFVSALEHYVTRYGEPARPPTWIVMEELSFGSMRNVYASLANTTAQNDIARTLGLRAPVLASWLLTYQRVRNICAHHGRLWNRGLGVYPAIPKSRAIRWIDDGDLFIRDEWRRQRLYPVLVSLQTMLHTIAPGSSWAWRLDDLFHEHPAVPLSGMGIPRGWIDDPFWPRRHP